MAYNLLNKTALVVGGSRGIGRAISERLGHEGATVVVNYAHNRQAAEAVVETIISKGGKAHAVQADISQTDDIKRLFDETEEAVGKLQIVIANAATALIKPAIEVSEAEYDAMFDTNAKGIYFVMQEAAKRLADGGRIVVTSTGGTKMLFPGNSVYLGTKGALQQFVRTFAQELGPRNITVNSLLPGFTNTELLPDRDREVAASASPFGRIGEPEDVADVAVFLASDDARWVTGQEIGAAGGVF